MRLYNYLDLLYFTIVISNNNRVLLLIFSHVFYEKEYRINYFLYI